MEALQAQLSALEGQRDDLQGLINDFAVERDSINQDLGAITSSVSGKIVLDTVSYSGIWTIRGSAPDIVTILNYVFTLQSNSRFQIVELSSVSELTFYEWNFVINIRDSLME
jgi:hypothetical protein